MTLEVMLHFVEKCILLMLAFTLVLIRLEFKQKIYKKNWFYTSEEFCYVTNIAFSKIFRKLSLK